MQGLSLFTLRIQLLAGALKVVDHGQDLAQGAAGELQLEIFGIPLLTLAEVVEISRDAHVLAAHGLVLLAQSRELSLQRGGAITALGRSFRGIRGDLWLSRNCFSDGLLGLSLSHGLLLILHADFSLGGRGGSRRLGGHRGNACSPAMLLGGPPLDQGRKTQPS